MVTMFVAVATGVNWLFIVPVFMFLSFVDHVRYSAAWESLNDEKGPPKNILSHLFRQQQAAFRKTRYADRDVLTEALEVADLGRRLTVDQVKTSAVGLAVVSAIVGFIIYAIR
jgi:hypothetical protein